MELASSNVLSQTDDVSLRTDAMKLRDSNREAGLCLPLHNFLPSITSPPKDFAQMSVNRSDRQYSPSRFNIAANIFFVLATMMISSVAIAGEDEFPKAFNTDPPDSHPPTPEEMVKLIEVPPGFNVTLFAGEPDVQQPICMDFDDKGRLWVAECYSYSGGPYETKLRDRVIILEDTDGDGKHDSRKVFWDKGFMLTSLTWGFGGLVGSA